MPNNFLALLIPNRPKGHQLQQPQIDRESFPNMEKGEAVCRYYEAKAPIDQTLGMLLSRVHPRQYETNGNTYNHWAQRSMLRVFKCTEQAQWPLNVTLVNARVGPHVDASDSPWSMVAMLASGDFTNGGNIICPQLGKQYVLREGGVLFMIARLLHHFVGSYEGQRISHVYAMHQCLYNVDAAVPASEMRMERKRKREAKEPTGELDASRGYVLCTFCQRPFDEEINLKRHLAKWRKAAPAEEDKNHKVDAVRAFAEREGWRPVVKERKRRKTEKSTGSQPSSRPVANVEASTSASSMTHQPHSNLEESMATSQPVAGLSSPRRTTPWIDLENSDEEDETTSANPEI